MVALYGAVLSTYNVVAQRNEKRHQLRVHLSFGFNVYGTPGGGSTLGPTVLSAEARNPGYRTVTITSVGLQLPNRRQMFLDLQSLTPPLPYDLEPGRNYVAWVEEKTVAETLKAEGLSGTVKLRGFYADALGSRFWSKSIKFHCN